MESEASNAFFSLPLIGRKPRESVVSSGEHNHRSQAWSKAKGDKVKRFEENKEEIPDERKKVVCMLDGRKESFYQASRKKKRKRVEIEKGFSSAQSSERKSTNVDIYVYVQADRKGPQKNGQLMLNQVRWFRKKN